MTDDDRPKAKLPPCPLGCRERVFYARTERGANQVLNAAPDDEGNVAAHKDVHGQWRARYSPPGERLASPEKRYMPHMATCKKAPKRQPEPAEPPSGEGLAGVTFLNTWQSARSRQSAQQRNQRGRGRLPGAGRRVPGRVIQPPDGGRSK